MCKSIWVCATTKSFNPWSISSVWVLLLICYIFKVIWTFFVSVVEQKMSSEHLYWSYVSKGYFLLMFLAGKVGEDEFLNFFRHFTRRFHGQLILSQVLKIYPHTQKPTITAKPCKKNVCVCIPSNFMTYEIYCCSHAVILRKGFPK